MNAARSLLALSDTYITWKFRVVWELLLQEDSFRLLTGLADGVEDEIAEAMKQESYARVVKTGCELENIL